MMKKMEEEYIEEIEDLKRMIDDLKDRHEEHRTDQHPENPLNSNLDVSESALENVQQTKQLQVELKLSKMRILDLESQNAILREKIDILEVTESVCYIFYFYEF